MRFDLQTIASWIEPGARVLDLGCGRGDLLHHLKENKQVRGTGIEAREERVSQAIARGLSVVQGDILEEVRDYPDWTPGSQDKGFDYVILSQTLMQIYDAPGLIREMLRVGRRGIVSFPNFGHWSCRLHLLLTGTAPVTRELPYAWYNTPNIRVVTPRDFKHFCKKKKFPILREAAINSDCMEETGHILQILPDLRAKYGIFMLGDGGSGSAVPASPSR